MKPYKAKNGNMQYVQHIEDLMAVADDDGGYCLACGEQADGIEPDAEKYECENCGKPKVYGAQQLILRGLYHE